jgi:hypothetical protein
MTLEGIMAAAAVGLTIVGYVDMRRRVANVERRFEIEDTADMTGRLLLRNTGSLPAKRVEFDLSKLKDRAFGGDHIIKKLDPNETSPFWLNSGRYADPVTIRLRVGLFRRGRYVAFPKRDPKQESPTETEAAHRRLARIPHRNPPQPNQAGGD